MFVPLFAMFIMPDPLAALSLVVIIIAIGILVWGCQMHEQRDDLLGDVAQLQRERDCLERIRQGQMVERDRLRKINEQVAKDKDKYQRECERLHAELDKDVTQLMQAKKAYQADIDRLNSLNSEQATEIAALKESIKATEEYTEGLEHVWETAKQASKMLSEACK